MYRREFLIRSTSALGATWLTAKRLTSKNILAALASQPLATKFTAIDTVTLGNTGIKTSRLAMGTGTVGSGHHSNQTALGVKGLSDLLLNGYRQSHRTYKNLGPRSRHRPRRSRPLPPRTPHRLSRYLPDALPHRSRLDRALQRRDGRFLRSQAEGNHPRSRLLLPQHRSPARRRQIAMGGSRSRPHQSHRLPHGRRSRNRRRCLKKFESRRQSCNRHEDPWSG